MGTRSVSCRALQCFKLGINVLDIFPTPAQHILRLNNYTRAIEDVRSRGAGAPHACSPGDVAARIQLLAKGQVVKIM